MNNHLLPRMWVFDGFSIYSLTCLPHGLHFVDSMYVPDNRDNDFTELLILIRCINKLYLFYNDMQTSQPEKQITG